MRTVQPCTMIGSYGFDQDRVPADEFQIRMQALREDMDQIGCKAMLVFGDASEHAELAYFTNFIPRHRWALALLPRQGDPRLLVSSSSRDMPAMRRMTWIAEVMSAWSWESTFDPWVAALGADSTAAIGTVRFNLMRPSLLQSIEKSLGDRFRLEEADHNLMAMRSRRPRELSLIRDACRIVEAAAAAIRKGWRNGLGNEAATLAGECVARAMAAQDVRTLTSFDGGRTLAPFRGTLSTRTDPFLAYIAVKHRGYWAELFVSITERPSEIARRAEAGLAAAIEDAEVGANSGRFYAKATEALGSYTLHPVLSGSVGRCIGLSLDEGSDASRDSDNLLYDVYALHVGAHDPEAGGVIASAMIRMTPTGCEVLVRSDEGASCGLVTRLERTRSGGTGSASLHPADN